PERVAADDAKQLAQEADIDGPLVDWKQKGHRVEYLGTEDVDGTRAHKLRVTLKDGDVLYVYLDPDAFLEIRVTRYSRVRGIEQISETDFGDYEQVAGVWIPFSRESGAKGQPKGSHVTIEHAEVNVEVDDAAFHFPKGPPGRIAIAAPNAPAGITTAPKAAAAEKATV